MSERNKYDKESDEVKNNLLNLKDREGLEKKWRMTHRILSTLKLCGE